MTRATFRVAFASVVSMLVLPVWLSPVAPFSDWPNHLARIHVLAHYSSSAAYQQYYQPAWGPYPNLAFDLIGTLLARLLPTELVGQLFLMLVVLVWCAGVAMLGRAIEGSVSWRVLLACFFVYSESFLLGYANYAISMGLSLIALGLAFAPGGASRLAGLGATIIATCAVVSHAAAAVTLGLGGLSLMAGRAIERKQAGEKSVAMSDVKLALLFAPAALYFVIWLVLFADHTRDSAFSGVRTSLALLFFSVLPTFVTSADWVLVALLAMLAASSIMVGGGARGLAKRVRPGPAIAAALFVLAVFVAPADYLGSYEANGRYVLGAWTFALFAIETDGALRHARAFSVLVGAALSLLVVRQAFLGFTLSQLGQRLAATIALFDRLPAADVHIGNVTFLNERAPRAQRLRERALLHAVAYTAVTREADVPTLYAIPGVQPLRHRAKRYDGHRFKMSDPAAVDVARVHAELDAALVCRAPASVREALLEGGESLGVAGDCELIRWR